LEDPLFNLYARIYYDPKNPANLRDFQNRQVFLRAAAQNVPGFADSLFKVTWARIHDWIKLNGSLPRPDSPAYGEFYSQIFAEIRGWARSYKIEVNWVIDEAFSAVVLGLRYAETGIDPVEAFGGWRRTHAGTAMRAFQLPAWEPLEECEPSYIARADRAWRQARKQYIAATKADPANAGRKLLPAPRKRRISPGLRLKWAVLHRCAGKSIEELADEYREETEPIRISVSRVLKDLGFDPPT